MPGKIHVPVTVATQGFEKLQRTFGRLKGAAVGVTAALGGLSIAARAIDFSGAAIQGARDLERNYAGLTSVFKENTEQMKEFGRTASEMGLSMNEAAKATTFIGSVLKQSGFSIAETADLTEELVELGADLALTYGYDVQEALLGMTALFRGEYDPIEKFGVAMKQSEIDAEKAARGLDGLTGAAERFADQQIRVEFLMERAGDAMGAFERQSGNLTVQQMRLRAEFENIRDTVADDLLPPLAALTGGIRDIAQDAGPGLEDLFDRLAPLIEKVGRDALPLIDSAIQTTLTFFSELIGFFEEAMDPTTDLNNSLSNAGDAIGSLAERIGANIPTMAEQFDILADAVGGFSDALAGLASNIEVVFGPLFDMFASMEAQVRAGTLTAIAAGLVAIKVGFAGIAAVFTKHPILSGIFLGTMVLGELGKRLEKDAEMTKRFEKTVSDLNYEMLENLTVQEEAGLQVLTHAKAQGTLNETLEEFPDLKPLAERLGIIATAANTFTNETEKGKNGLKDFESVANSVSLSGIEGRFKALFDRIHDVRGETALLLDGMTQLEKIQQLMTPENVAQKGITDQMRAAYRAFLKETEEDTGGGAAATDFVGDFFDGIQQELKKQTARVALGREFGLSEALIDQIVGSEGFEEIFKAIAEGGQKVADELQADFNRTAAGIAEIKKAAEELEAELQGINDQIKSLNDQIDALELQRDSDIKAATESFMDFKYAVNVSVDALDTYQRTIGQFEAQTNSDLQRIEGQIMSAFDNEYLLEDAKNNLLDYARAELNALANLQRQRDELLTRRNAASDVILGVAQAVTSAGSLTSLLSDVQDSVEEIEVTELFERMSKSADGLRDFKVTVERNFTDVITNTVDKSKVLVSNFQAVIDRTRGFIDNLKLLRELGLDPFLFNQLVQAGAEAGGATAQALVEGGAETVNEVNQLQTELEEMGVELGEQTYNVTKNTGEQFVSGIIDGMDGELENLAEKAADAANIFTETFAMMFDMGMNAAFEQITDTIRSEFRMMIDELEAELRAVQDRHDRLAGVGDYYVPPADTIYPDADGNYSLGMPDLDLPQAELDFLQESGFFDASPDTMSASGTVQQTVVNNNYFGSEPLDLYKSSKQNVVQQSTFQSSNGSISATLSGVGN